MQILFSIAAGGAIGALLRHYLNSALAGLLGTEFPWGILIANVLGSFVMGCLITGFALLWEPSQAARAFLTVGLLGAFTTFSTFSLDAVTLIERGALGAAALYIIGSVVLAISGLFAGMALMREIAL